MGRNFCRAYKLGKKRWLYNECKIHLHQQIGSMKLGVMEAHRQGPEALPESLQVNQPCTEGPHRLCKRVVQD